MINTASLRFTTVTGPFTNLYLSGIKSLLRVAVSFTTNKLDESIQDIQSSVEAIEKLAPIVDARRAKGEQEDARHERIEAGLERLEAGVERHAL